ncbi:MAG: hypothetical protein KAU06_04560 [Candidatus Marinimicrobia bacterium]|nr:hypothetical protein [Candidatus Neomarinimicrobiota bacterium]
MRKKKPYQAKLEEVTISRDGDNAIITYRDPDVATTYFRLGAEIDGMTDREILDLFNQTIDARELLAATYHHVAIEVSAGHPQIKYFADGDQWTPRGDVLRCIIEGDGLDNEDFIFIDDQALTLKEFGKLLSTCSGWGMRITFVPENELENEPEIDIRKPD